MTGDVDEATLRGELREKYEEMRRLRVGDANGTIVDPRARMSGLASRFPGVLREIDRLPLTEIERRLRLLEGPEELAEWAVVSHRFHALLRGALCAKSWLSRRKPDDALMSDFTEATATLCFGREALEWKDELSAVRAPPAGRLTTLVLARISRETGRDTAEIHQLLFPWTADGG